jgi:hypothetical protein
MGIRGKSSFGGGDLGFIPKRVKKNEPLFHAAGENSPFVKESTTHAGS